MRSSVALPWQRSCVVAIGVGTALSQVGPDHQSDQHLWTTLARSMKAPEAKRHVSGCFSIPSSGVVMPMILAPRLRRRALADAGRPHSRTLRVLARPR